MEELKVLRKPLRQSFTITANALETEFERVDIEFEKLHILSTQLNDKFQRLEEVHSKIADLLLKAEDETEFLTDFKSAEEYRDKYFALKAKVESKMRNAVPIITSPEMSNTDKRKFKLPKLELHKFNGEIRNWMGFWGQFRKIDEDSGIDDDDKFQYLVQATVAGSPARELVESYPPSGANYKKAITQMKSRFARDELLVEIYVRELLGLVLAQATKDGSMSLATLYDKLETQLRALETLGVKSEIYAAMLYPLVESALPEEILKAWERSRSSKETVVHTENLKNLLNFLRIEVESEERLQLARTGFAAPAKEDYCMPATAACIYTGDSKKALQSCIWCDKGSHSSSDCYKLHNFSAEEKINLLKKKKACFICLKIGHNAQKCRSSVKCLICNRRHVTAMCKELKSSKDSKRETKDQLSEKKEVLFSNQRNGTTLLQTVLIKIVHKGKSDIIRALFDNGAQRSYIRKDIVERLGLVPSDEETLSHNLFGGVETKPETHRIFDIKIQNLDNKFQYSLSVLDEDKLCGYVPRIESENINAILRKKRIKISDTGTDAPAVGLLIGADFSGQLMTGTIVPLEKNLVAIQTKLGWTLQGPIGNQASVVGLCNLDLTELWNLETIGIKDPADVKTKENLNAETVNFFRDTIKITEDKRYEVCLPWKDGHPILGDNKDKAEKRLIDNTRRLQKLGYLKEYDEILREWHKTGVIEIAPENDVVGHFLPHQAVIKNSSLTTRIRPVFDASTKDERGNTLNACLEKGPNLVEFIPKLLMQFRKHAFGVTADVKKAFLQINLSPSDRSFLKFLWWKDMNLKEFITYRHCRVVFGISSSPFLLGATISYHLDNAPQHLKETALRLKKSFYVDNCVISLESEEEVNKFKVESQALMSSAGFDLRAWTTTPCTGSEVSPPDQKVVPILGLTWDIQKDEIYCNIADLTLSENTITKRTLLSVAQKIFDPVGFTSPTTLIPKLILQKTWKRKIRWDESLPPDLNKEFLSWAKHVQFLNDCKIPRRLVIGPFNECIISLHSFSDASKVAYAACVFLRASYDGKTSVQLVQSKSRVAPARGITIPRLELLGALISTRLYCQVIDSLNLSDCKVYFWTDSTVALTWIKREAHWNTFVGNRVAEIRKFTDPDNWRYVPGSMNPADLPSRGCSAKTLLQSRWWEGPDWLKQEQENWPAYKIINVDEQIVDSERRKTVVSSISCSKPNFIDDLTRFSHYHKNIRVLAWILRFFKKTQHKESGIKKELTWEEVNSAEIKLLSLIQADSFQDRGKMTLKKMHTFKDQCGLYRVRTKLVLGEEDEDFKCPILLPGNHALVHSLIEQKHRQLQHAGTRTLISNLRENYWIIGVRRIVKKVCSRCVTCKRFKCKSVEPPFAPLPKDRIKYAGAFEVTGVDLAGPLYTLSGEKAWIVLFTCAIYRAVHFELTKSLSTESFIMALRRFIARRGRVSVIYSDNGTNFVGANNALKELDWDKIMTFSTIERIKWNFNPPTAAWWGGFWERLVRMVKELLRRVLGQRTISYVELETILCDCEATMNSRPLTYIEDETTDLKPLTPACFIQGIPHNEVKDLDCIDSTSLNRRLRYLQKLRVDLRTRFRNEYLAMLVHRGQRRGETLQVGDVVLLGTPGKRINWPLGLVVQIFQGSDGHVRVAKVKTAESEKIRPVQNLYPLEVSRPTELPRDARLQMLQQKDQVSDPKISYPVELPLDCQSKIPCLAEPTAKSRIKDTSITTRSGRPIKIPKRLDL